MRSGPKAIDVWDTETFDDELRELLQQHAELISEYLIFDRQEFLDRESTDGWRPPKQNPRGSEYMAFMERVGLAMKNRAIRGWHYTRLTDDEVAAIHRNGIYPGTLETLRERLNARVCAGDLSEQEADEIYRASPCHHNEQKLGRLGKFWFASRPFDPMYSGVELLLNNWGGEAAYFWLQDQKLKNRVSNIGRPYVLEIAVPISYTGQWYWAGQAVVCTFARSLGLHASGADFDFYSTKPLGPDAVLAVHAEGTVSFAAVADQYPD
ncbi:MULTISPECIES: hypothetical protein [unclassified Afipia]|uniref:hypothetical protein n=1 Tax=unclassified Afipia TaxID=2642050 RepID=UPI000467C11D|nr:MULTISPECIES: hypothetical protein [unclassified Afipia]MBQ8105571.1 hypothetical protein [Afipia sp.]MCS6329340.1 hypothetical protein [Nitrospira sp.]